MICHTMLTVSDPASIKRAIPCRVIAFAASLMR
jgi:hypothetical protein